MTYMQAIGRWFVILVVLSGAAITVHAQQTELTREQALSGLTQDSPAARVAGAQRLAEVGTMGDIATLMRALRDEDENVRDASEQAIWRIWGRSGDPAIDAMYRRGIMEMHEGSSTRALSTFNEIIRLKPEFAEAWNKRATLYFMQGEYIKSLKDCEEVLKRVPEHFGVLSGFGQIYIELNQPDRALEYFQRALNINPNLTVVQSTMDKIERMIRARQSKEI